MFKRKYKFCVTKNLIKIILVAHICFYAPSLHAQLNATTIGSAVNQGGNCFLITPNLLNQSGGVWYNNPINFLEDFTIYYQNNFGSNDINGADGMALVFKGNSTPQIGGVGGGLGYEGISPSLIVEFDTWQNTVNGDPTWDHIAIIRNGIPNHNSLFNTLAGPIQASATNANIEDGQDHEIKIQWNASAQTFNVYFDCALRLSLALDLRNVIFSGDNDVFFGFVGSTGGSSNLHQVCFNNITFVENLTLPDQSICFGESVNLDATIPSGNTYSWSPTTGIDNPNIANPNFTPSTTTDYTVTINDICGETTTETVTISVLPSNNNPTFNQVPAICNGDTLSPLPTISNEGIIGTWGPVLDNTRTTTYTFVPNSGQCAVNQTMTIVVNPILTPTFNQVSPICFGDIIAPLPAVSNEGIIGTWSPTLDNTTTTTYTFVPNSGVCVTNQTMTVEVNPLVTPTFNQVSPICNGDFLGPLPTTSIEGIIGVWSPMLDNTVTTTYTFTPNLGECAINQTMTIVVNPNRAPTFIPVPAICNGDILSPLPTTSIEGITGTWSPALDNTVTTTYTFTPDPGFCPLPVNFTIEVFDNPAFNLQDEYFLCFDTDGTLVTPNTLNTGLNTADYNFTWLLNEVVISGANQGSYNPIEEGRYEVIVQNSMTLCQTRLLTDVVALYEPDFEANVITEAFSENQTIEVTVFNIGDFEYQLDGGTWQDAPIFSNVTLGEHVVTVRDKRGCIEASETIVVMDYPKCFTPNGDGFHDTWNITAPRIPLDYLALSKVRIFDRYGKLLKEIDPTGDGWNGIYNGALMHSDDYWFVVEYTEPRTGEPKTFRSNFTLKR